MGAVRILLALQGTQAAVFGTVRDAHTGEPLAGAVVALSDLERAVATDARGRYVVRNVPPGPQHLTIQSIGYAQRTLHALVPSGGELEINVALRPEPIALRALEVRSPVPLRGVDHGDSTDFPERKLSMAAVRNHPLLAEPDVFQALGGGVVVMSAEAPRGVHVRGSAADHTAYVLDGIPVLSPYHAAGVFSAWNPDALSSVRLSSAPPSPLLPDALGGVIAAVTRSPGTRFSAQGSVSSAQARITIDGPLGAGGGAGYLLSLRTGFPDFVAPRGEASYLGGEVGDWLAKLEAPAFGGRIRVLGYESENEIDAMATVEAPIGPSPPVRNAFEWRSSSAGVTWSRAFGSTSMRVQGWRALSDAGARWLLRPDETADMSARRQDEGALMVMEHTSAEAMTATGLRIERSTTSYRVASDSTNGASWSRNVRLPMAAAFVQHARPVGARVHADLGLSLTLAARGVRVGPRARLDWQPTEPLTLSGSYVRLHQFAQSLRNAESVVGTIFPADLYLGAGDSAVPVARSDQGVGAAEYRPLAGLTLGLQAYERASDGLLLVAPHEGEPFTTSGFTTGSSRARGVAAEAALSSHRMGVLASYGWQRVRLEYDESDYVPEHGAAHLIETGVIVFPSATSSVRVGATGILGRRTTSIAGAFEWEACNLLDQGCEFAGSPRYQGESLGATTLPPYLRIDVGARKHWHFDVGKRDASVALFGTITNLLGRRNVLTYSRDPSSGQLAVIEMRPLAPLVLGLDWSF